MNRTRALQAEAAVPVAPRDHALEHAARRHAAPRSAATAGPMSGPLTLGPGVPLPSAERQHFEQRLGCDFGAVRLHADAPAAGRASQLRAHAFTSGTHIGFAAGRWRPDTAPGRALLGHELVHVAQVQAAGAGSMAANIVWRAGEDEAYPEDPPTPQLSVEVTTNTDLSPVSLSHLNEPDTAVDQTGQAIFEGDVIALQLQGSDGEPLPIEALALPEGLARVETSTAEVLLLRVESAAGATSLQVAATGAQAPRAQVMLNIQPRPAPAGAINPDITANTQAREALKAERRSSRQARRDERRSLRGAGREQRRAARRARRDERRDQRARARTLRQERRALRDDHSCSPETQAQVDTAQRRGVQVCDAALAALAAKPQPGPAAMAALSRIMKIDPAQDGAAAATVQAVIDVLSTARNNLAAATYPGGFTCADCERETTGAYVSQHQRGGIVTLCQLWRQGNGLKFDGVRSVDDARAYALVHEFVHLAGPSSAGDEHYVSDKGAWAGVTAARALTMADAYAAVAWAAGSGSPR